MAGPCLADTNSIIMSRDLSGNIKGDVRLHAGDSGLGIVSDGLYVNNLAGDGIQRHAFGLSVRMKDEHVGWFPGVNDFSTPGTAVGPGGYVQVGGALSLNLSIMGTPQVVAQTIEMSYGAVVDVADSDASTVNFFHGWSIILERSFQFGPWVEVNKASHSGAYAEMDNLVGREWVFLGGGTFNMQLRITMRGGLAGTSIARSVQQYFMHASYH